MTTTAFSAAVASWRELLGAEQVLDDPETLGRLGRATYRLQPRLGALLRPGTRADVRQIIAIARRYRQPLHPISGGQNLGYGSRVPPVDGGIVVDLGRLDRILAFDSELGALTVEPGVTFRQAYQFLREREPRWSIGGTGGPLTGSLIGNALQRGLGSADQVDLWRGILALEVVLEDGAVVPLGLAAWPGSRATGAALPGPGPALAGLFSQANWGIVTEATIALLRTPQHPRVLRWQFGDAGDLPALVSLLRELRQTCRNIDSMRLYNHNKVLAARRICPPLLQEADGYLSPEATAALAGAAGAGCWQGAIGIQAATDDQLQGVVSWLTAALSARVARLSWHDVSAIFPPSVHADWSQIPDLDGALGSIYWKMPDVARDGGRLDPDGDGVGNLWYAPTLPFTGVAVAEAATLAEAVCAAHRLEPVLEVIVVDERTLVMTVALTWDRRIDGTDECAAACHRALVGAFAARGYYPYRTGIDFDCVPPPDAGLVALWRRLERTMNPRGVFARSSLMRAALDPALTADSSPDRQAAAGLPRRESAAGAAGPSPMEEGPAVGRRGGAA